MHLSEISTIINATLAGIVQDLSVDYLLTDSRSLWFPEKSLFFALRTNSGDGHLYINDLIGKGVRAFVVNADYAIEADHLKQATFFKVESPLKALQDLAAHKRAYSRAKIIGITGSNGKTMVKEWLQALLKNQYNVARSPMSYNSQIGVPLSVWTLSEQTEVGIFEAGISHPGEMEALQRIVNPEIGVFTHLGTAHQEHFDTLKQKGLEKMKLFTRAQVLIYSVDDATLCQVVEESGFSGASFTWSRTGKAATLSIENIEINDESARITYRYAGQPTTIALPFTDNASITNAIHCLAVCLYLNATPSADEVQALSALPMRLELKSGIKNCVVINDSYSSDMVSLATALDFMTRRWQNSSEGGIPKKKVAILSDMHQTGLGAAELYAQMAMLTEKHGVDIVIGVGRDFVAHQSCFKSAAVHTFYTTQALLESHVLKKLSNAVVLVKGSRQAAFERVSEKLTTKAHATTLEVDLSALAYNLRQYRAMLQHHVRMVCMIKASAYGIGDIEVARTLADAGADYLAVASVDEGVALREAGIATPIIIMNPEPSSLLRIFNHHLEPEVYSFKLLEALIQTAEALGLSNLNIHLKLDTGMTRLGFCPETDIPKLAFTLKAQHRLIPRSVFSHFVGSDDSQFDAFTQQQFARFTHAAHELQAHFNHHVLKHICNSAAIERFPSMHLDMVRLGIGLYGVSPFGHQNLANVASLKTVILQIHDALPTQTVGYSRRGTLHSPSRIATLPIGYADGLNRRLGCGKGYAIVNGKRAPYVGNICMDVCMIDVTNIDCHEGDVVEIYGPQLPITDVAQWLDTIPYEILTSVSERVHRVYVKS